MATTEGATTESLGKRLFKARLDLIGELDERAEPAAAGLVGGPLAPSYPEPKTELAEPLRVGPAFARQGIDLGSDDRRPPP